MKINKLSKKAKEELFNSIDLEWAQIAKIVESFEKLEKIASNLNEQDAKDVYDLIKAEEDCLSNYNSLVARCIRHLIKSGATAQQRKDLFDKMMKVSNDFPAPLTKDDFSTPLTKKDFKKQPTKKDMAPISTKKGPILPVKNIPQDDRSMVEKQLKLLPGALSGFSKQEIDLLKRIRNQGLARQMFENLKRRKAK